VYGREDLLHGLERRRQGEAGELAHKEACEKQRSQLEEQLRRDRSGRREEDVAVAEDEEEE
jgi:hypothetical protein